MRPKEQLAYKLSHGLVDWREAICRDSHKYECAVVGFYTLGLSVDTAKRREIDVSLKFLFKVKGFIPFIHSTTLSTLDSLNL